MKHLLIAAALLAGVAPGVLVFVTWKGIPPVAGYEWLFGGFIEATSLLSLALLWLNRARLGRLSGGAATKTVLLSLAAAVALALTYLMLFNHCVVEFPGRGAVYYPLWDSGELATVVRGSGGRAQAIDEHGRGEMADLAETMTAERSITTAALLVNYSLVFVALTAAFGLVVVRGLTPQAAAAETAPRARGLNADNERLNEMGLSGQQIQSLSEALRHAFPKRRLEELLRFKFDKSLDDIALGDDYREIVFKLLEATEAEGWTMQLVAAARESNPGNPGLLAFAQSFGLASLRAEALSRSSLESMLREKNSFLDVERWRTLLGEIEPRVCRIEFESAGDTAPNGTGFLVAPDLVLTNYHVVKPVIDRQVRPEDVRLRFDYKRLSDGRTLNPGTVFGLGGADAWLVDVSPYSPLDVRPAGGPDVPRADELDYALLRVEGEPGNQPVGGAKADPQSPRRGWLELPSDAYDFRPGSPLFIMQHPEGEPLKLAFDTESVIGLNANGTRVRYRTNTEPGSSGSPCFNLNWEPVALHHSGEPNFNPTYNQGIPLKAIKALLDERGVRLTH